jgi:hypothetical protein
MCECCQKREERDKAMWLGIARALVTLTRGITGVANAIEKRYGDKPVQNRRVA